jgi:integrase
LRRAELATLNIEDIQIRQGHWAIVDLIGKGGHIRTVSMPLWVKSAVTKWIAAARLTDGRVFRAVSKHGTVWGSGVTENVVWYAVRDCSKRIGLEHMAPHDLAGHAPSYTTRTEASLNEFSFFSVMPRC